MDFILNSIKYYYYILIPANIIITFFAAWHALLYKRDPRASLGWLAIILMFPVFGYISYFLFGINRIRTRARILTGKLPLTGFIGFKHIPYKIAQPRSLAVLPAKKSMGILDLFAVIIEPSALAVPTPTCTMAACTLPVKR